MSNINVSNIKQRLLDQKAEIDQKLSVINRVPEDTFNFGTVLVFSARTGHKWYYVKINEETWQDKQSNDGAVAPLVDWIFDAINSNIGYFEVYVMTPAEIPIFASS